MQTNVATPPAIDLRPILDALDPEQDAADDHGQQGQQQDVSDRAEKRASAPAGAAA